jgi:succinoglycan biosynthesis protein ExoA
MTKEEDENTPLLTIIMPVYNEEKYIEKTLTAIRNQDYLENRMEVIIVDGRSHDATKEKVIAFSQNNSHLDITVLDNDRRIFPAGFNKAMQYARGDVIIILGGHTFIAVDYVSQCVAALQKYDCVAVGGSIETVSKTYQGKAIAAAMASPFGVGGVSFRTKKGRTCEVDTVAFAAYRRDAIIAAGLMDEELVRNQDDEFNYRLRKLGGKIYLSADIHASYHSRSSLSSLWRQYFQYGYWKVRVLQKHPLQMRPRQFIPPLFVLAALLSALLMLLVPFGYYLFVLVIGSYSIANLFASLAVARKQGLNYFFLLPFVFFILHFSYGLGFLIGLAKFLNRWGDKNGKVPDFMPVFGGIEGYHVR